jgi:hypothetical protein
MVIGLGALATGSGAMFSSAAFANSAASSADLRVVVEESLNFRPNPDAAENNDNVLGPDDLGDDGGFFDGNDLDDSEEGAFADNDPPLAATNGEANEDLELSAVAGLGDVATFEELFILENNSTETVNVGIAYDRGDSNFDTDSAAAGQYGDDIGVNENSGLTPAIPRGSYQFSVNSFEDNSGIDDEDFYADNQLSNVISPAENGTLPADGSPGSESSNSNAIFVGDDTTISAPQDRPADAITLSPGASVTIDLNVDLDYDTAVRDAIREQADIEFDGFGTTRDTVDLLDGITVGTLTNGASSSSGNE